MSNYKQLTYEQRCQIEVLKKSGMTQQAIADAVGTGQSTISRELKRNTGQRGYRHKQARRLAVERRHNSAKAVKMTESMIETVEQRLVEMWSPEQISGWLEKERDEQLSHEWIYQHIWEDKRMGGELYIHKEQFEPIRRSPQHPSCTRDGVSPSHRFPRIKEARARWLRDLGNQT